MFTKRFLLDLLERSVATFVQTFAGTLVGDGLLNNVHIPWSAKLAIAGTAGLGSVLKSLAATQLGASDSASVLPASLDPPSEEAKLEAARD